MQGPALTLHVQAGRGKRVHCSGIPFVKRIRPKETEIAEGVNTQVARLPKSENEQHRWGTFPKRRSGDWGELSESNLVGRLVVVITGEAGRSIGLVGVLG